MIHSAFFGARFARLHAFYATVVRELAAHLRARLTGIRMDGADCVGVTASARHQRETERGDIRAISRKRSALFALRIA